MHLLQPVLQFPGPGHLFEQLLPRRLSEKRPEEVALAMGNTVPGSRKAMVSFSKLYAPVVAEYLTHAVQHHARWW